MCVVPRCSPFSPFYLYLGKVLKDIFSVYIIEMDYKSIHLAWIKNTRNFVPKYATDYTEPYYDVIRQMYSHNGATQEFAKVMYHSDIRWWEECLAVQQQEIKAVKKDIKQEPKVYFVTIGFNHQTWSIEKCTKAISKILEFDWIIKAKANFELFRENGEHPHCHFYISTFEPKSKVLEKLFRPNYIQQIVLKKSFIDLKVAEDYHYKYIMLDKVVDKMGCVEKDIQWRIENDIPDYEKNWN